MLSRVDRVIKYTIMESKVNDHGKSSKQSCKVWYCFSIRSWLDVYDQWCKDIAFVTYDRIIKQIVKFHLKSFTLRFTGQVFARSWLWSYISRWPRFESEITYQFGPFASDNFLFNLIIFIINKLMFYNSVCSIVMLAWWVTRWACWCWNITRNVSII